MPSAHLGGGIFMWEKQVFFTPFQVLIKGAQALLEVIMRVEQNYGHQKLFCGKNGSQLGPVGEEVGTLHFKRWYRRKCILIQAHSIFQTFQGIFPTYKIGCSKISKQFCHFPSKLCVKFSDLLTAMNVIFLILFVLRLLSCVHICHFYILSDDHTW